MEGFFDLLKSSGKALYESYLYLVTMTFCMSIALFTPPKYDILAILSIFIISIISLATGRIITFFSTVALVGYLGCTGHFPILVSS